jgi:DNA polymerase-3 subunit delta'
MLRWVRDLVLYRTAGEEAQLVNVDQAEAVARFCDNLPDADLDAMARVVEEAIRLTERNVNMKLLLQVLSQALRAAMQGRPARLYEPLSDPDALAA